MKSAPYSTIGVQFLSWALLAAIAVMTLGPIGLRPQTHFSPDLERLAAYVMLGMSFALSYPQRRLRLLGAFLIATALVLEIGQSLVPSRDPHLSDFLFKAGGAVIGLVSLRVAYLAVLLRRRRFVAVP
jgi:VanZ family protein